MVVHHYRYDSDRQARRYVVVAVYDIRDEFRKEFDRLADMIRLEMAWIPSNSENLSGVILEPGRVAAAAHAATTTALLEQRRSRSDKAN
jgi:hypothetical protein